MSKLICIFFLIIFLSHTSYGQCPTPITGNTTINSPCTGDIDIVGASNNTTLTINAAVTGNITVNDQQIDVTINSSGSVSGSLTVNDQQVDLIVAGPIGGNLDINNQQITLDLSADITGALDLGDQQVNVDVTGDSEINALVTSGQQNDFLVDNGDNMVTITLTIQTDVCIEDQQNTISTGPDDIVNINGTLKCTGTGCNQVDLVGNVNTAACSAESGTLCTDPDLTIDTSLPVELVSFTATEIGNIVSVNWTTASEENNSHFTIQKSLDAETFRDIVDIPGAGNSKEVIRYQFDDTNPFGGLSYYRLRQTDFDGKQETFKTVALEYQGDQSFEIYPNPLLLSRQVVFENWLSAKAFAIYDYAGNKIQTGHVELGKNAIQLNGEFQSGLYFVQLATENRSKPIVKRLIIK